MRNKKIYIQYLIIFVLWFLTNTVSSQIGFLALILSAVFILIGRDIDVVRWIFFFLPNIRILDAIGFTSGINILLIVCSLKIIFFDTNEEGKNHIRFVLDKRAALAAMLVFVIEFSHAFLTSATIFATIFNATDIALDTLAGITLLEKGWSIDKFRKVVTSFFLGVFTSVIIYLAANPLVVRSIMISAYRLGAYGTDPNYLSVYVILSMAGILYISTYEKVKIYELVCFALLAVVGLLTASKMCLICMVAVVLIYVLVSFIQGKWKQLGRVILGVTPVVIIGTIVFKDSLLIFWNKLADRFANTTLTSGRDSLFDFYLTHIWDDFISITWGRGVGYFTYYQPKGAEYVAHNTYLDFLLSWGMLGCALFLIIMIYAYRRKIMFKNRNAVDFIMVLILAVMLLSLSCMSSDMFWFIVPYCFIPMTMYPKYFTL